MECLVANTPELHLNTNISSFLSSTVLLELCCLPSFNQALSLIDIFLITYGDHREFEDISVKMNHQLPIVISISLCTKMDFKNVMWPESGEVSEKFHLSGQIPNVDLGTLGV